ncbi:hypothetical protein BASA81_004935 [Batrachochytrium salamandrivorans]|nr:hypothetical protein BASA81_004935 [Batrachochytrium salamandrivorans]
MSSPPHVPCVIVRTRHGRKSQINPSPMLLNVLACLFASSAMLNVEAVEFVSRVGYEDLNCTGPVAYIQPFAIVNVCGEVVSEYISNVSLKVTCDGYQMWLGSTTCSGEVSGFEPITGCHTVDHDTMSMDMACYDFPDLVRVTMQYTNCSSLDLDGFSFTTDLVEPTLIAVGTCFPDIVVSGLSTEIGERMGQSFKVEKQCGGSGYTVTRFYSDDCTGTAAVFNDVVDGVCSEIGSGDGETPTSTQAVLLEVIASSTAPAARRLRDEPKPLTFTLEQLKKFFPNLEL